MAWSRNPAIVSALAVLSGPVSALAAHPAYAEPLVAATCTLRPGERGIVEAVRSAVELRLAGGLVVRLAGLEAPPDPAAALAMTALREMAGGREVELRYAGQERDRYGRALAHVYLAGEDLWLQADLVDRGLVRVAATPDGGACLGRLIAAEDAARQSNRGFWPDPAFAVKQHAASSLRHANQLYQLVEGRVLSTGRTRRAVYLNFGRDWSSDFTVIIPAATADKLAGSGLTWAALTGRRLRIRGWVEQRDGPMIEIAGAWQIEVLGD